MKKFYLLLAALFVFTFARAQKGLHLGVNVMPQNTWIFNLEDTDVSRTKFSYEFTMGYSAGALIGYNFEDPIGIHFRPQYSMQGQKHSSQDTSGNVITTSRELTYVKLPLMLNISGDVQSVMFSFGFGPQYSILQSVDIKENGTSVTAPFPLESLYKSYDIGVAFRIGADFMLSDNVFLNTHLAGDKSLMDIEDKDFEYQGLKVYEDGRPKTNNFVIGIMFGLTFIVPSGGGYGGF